ncbi:potassium channel family protein [Nordella sp. HKS 07]|uniref:potassium channel family protein n=1 Tax=Nordella sp. HKS 07 TaxID=2712222 RepID=UPI001FEF8560|nr:potassium channel family protein [Nordella sp. HKS 07]
MYFSGVTFTSLGYGDVVLDGQMRPLGPLQAANGLMMFGITTALFISVIQQVTANWVAAQSGRTENGNLMTVVKSPCDPLKLQERQD